MTKRRSFGRARQLPSGRWQARYQGPDGIDRPAPDTFPTKALATSWLAHKQIETESPTWRPPEASRVTLQEYAESVLATRRKTDGGPLTPKTLDGYRTLLRLYITPTLGGHSLDRVTVTVVRQWHAAHIAAGAPPVILARSYGLLSMIFKQAYEDDLISATPCRIRGALKARSKRRKPASIAEVNAMAALLPAPFDLMLLLAAFLGVRSGELRELRRKDIDLDAGLLHVLRGVVQVGGEFVVGLPKSSAGVRTLVIPPHLLPLLREHAATMLPDVLLFPARGDYQHMNYSTLRVPFDRARKGIGRPDLTWHDLRHTCLSLVAHTPGTTRAEHMAWGGHSTPEAHQVYQHADHDSARRIAAYISEVATGM